MASFSKKLCQAVEKRKVLYDRSIQHRVKRTHIESAWEAVALECNESVHSVKTRWRNIRKVLLRFVTKPNTSQTRKTRSKDYYLYEELQFLLPHLINVNPDDLADSDMEFGVKTENERTPVKDHMDDSNDCLSTLSASENSSMSSGMIGTEKRKRESKPGQEKSPNKTTNTNGDKCETIKSNEDYMISEPLATDASSSMRFRRASTKAKHQRETCNEGGEEGTRTLEMKSEEIKKSDGRESKLRKRSKSLYLERPGYGDCTDSDEEYSPPPPKKSAEAIKDGPPVVAKTTMVTRKKAARKAATLETTLKDGKVPTDAVGSADVEKKKINIKNETKESLTDDVAEEDFAGIDMTLLAAAAKAEAAAAAGETEAEETVAADKDESRDTNEVSPPVMVRPVPVVNTDASTQCDCNVDEEDEEFLQRLRKWMQVMTQRQKILFRRGIYQAYIDVYDDPREFSPQTGTEKFAPMAQGAPAIFTGMTPVELRLVRHLAMAVSGHKITASSSPYSNFENKDQRAMNSSDLNIRIPTMPANHPSTSGTRGQIEKSGGGGNGSGGGGGGIVRTTAIALTNHNGRSTGGMPRILRKVVRVGSNNNNSEGGVVVARNVVQQTGGTLLQRNQAVLRSRIVSSNASCSSGTGSDKQRVYRILPNGHVTRQSSGPGGPGSGLVQGSVSGQGSTANQNNANSPTSFSQSFAMLCNSNNSQQTPMVGKSISQFRQILPKMSTTPAGSGSAALTTVTANIEQKLSGISIRRHFAGGTGPGPGSPSAGSESRAQMSRRYSICGSAAANDMYATPNKDDGGSAILRRSAAAALQGQASDPTKIMTRVRYAQSPSSAVIRSGIVTQKFAIPSSPVSNQSSSNQPLSSSNNNKNSPNNVLSETLAGVPLTEPIPIAMATTWHTAQNISSREEEQDQMKLMQGVAMQDNDTSDQDPIASDEQQTNVGDEEDLLASKQNCIITSDAFESFVIKNEPLDLDAED